jgi:hypothetical protein
MEAGQRVKVFQKPITDEGFEGVAILDHQNAPLSDEVGEYWQVRFIDGRGMPESQTFGRWINERNVVPPVDVTS